MRARVRRWQEANRERLNAAARAYQRRPDVQDRRRERYQNDPAYRARRLAQNKPFVTQWRDAHPQAVRTWQNAYRRHRYHDDEAYRARRLAGAHHPARAHRPPAMPLPRPYSGDPLLEQAAQLAGTPFYGDYVYNADWEDAAGEAVLALLEGRDPKAAVAAYKKQRYVARIKERTLLEKFV